MGGSQGLSNGEVLLLQVGGVEDVDQGGGGRGRGVVVEEAATTRVFHLPVWRGTGGRCMRGEIAGRQIRSSSQVTIEKGAANDHCLGHGTRHLIL